MGLVDDPFDWQVTRSGRVRIFRGGREVVVLAGRDAEKLRRRLDGASDEAAQQALARATGNYRRGNERPDRP